MKHKPLFVMALGGALAALNFAPAAAESPALGIPGGEVCRAPVDMPSSTTTTTSPTTTTEPPTTTTPTVPDDELDVTPSTVVALPDEPALAPPTTVAPTPADADAAPPTAGPSGIARRSNSPSEGPVPLDKPFKLAFNVAIGADGTVTVSFPRNENPCGFKLPAFRYWNNPDANWIINLTDFKGWKCDKPTVTVDGAAVTVHDYGPTAVDGHMFIEIKADVKNGSKVKIDLMCAKA